MSVGELEALLRMARGPVGLCLMILEGRKGCW